MINVAIVEDEFMIAKRLKRFVETSLNERGPVTIRVFHQLDDASDYLSEHQIDILFLDLNMNGRDGFELLKSQLCKGFQTVVVSANADRAIEAYDLGVLDFVAKPFTQQRVQTACERLFSAERLGQCKYLTYHSGKQLKMMPIDGIEFIAADGHYCQVFSNSLESVLHEKNLDGLLKVLPPRFFRIHRSYAINLERLVSLTASSGSKYTVTLQSGEVLPVGRTRVDELRKVMQSG